VEKFGPNPTQPNITNNDWFPVAVRSAVQSNLTAWCNQILSNRALNALTQFFSKFLALLLQWTQHNPRKTEKSRPNPTQTMDNSAPPVFPNILQCVSEPAKQPLAEICKFCTGVRSGYRFTSFTSKMVEKSNSAPEEFPKVRAALVTETNQIGFAAVSPK